MVVVVVKEAIFTQLIVHKVTDQIVHKVTDLIVHKVTDTNCYAGTVVA